MRRSTRREHSRNRFDEAAKIPRSSFHLVQKRVCTPLVRSELKRHACFIKLVWRACMRVVSSSCCTIAMGERPRQELLYGLASLYHSRDFSDLVVFGKDGSRHAVHRAVLCPRSEYIYTAVKEGKWRVGTDTRVLYHLPTVTISNSVHTVGRHRRTLGITRRRR